MSAIVSSCVLDQPIVGFASGFARPKESVDVEVQGFYTSDDGPRLYHLLDQVYSSVLCLGCKLSPEQIQTALINIQGVQVTMLVNPQLEAQTVLTRSVQLGAPTYKDDMVDIESLRVPGHDLPTHGSLIFIFQQQWRRGLYFDFRLAHPTNPPPPLGDVGALLGSLWGALLHRDRIRMDDSVLDRMAADGWFPFTRLSSALAIELYRHVELNWDLAPIVHKLRAEIEPRLTEIVESWASKKPFAPHMDVLRDAARLFVKGEHRAAAAMLLPKVEGVLRHIYSGTKDRPRGHDLTGDLVGRIRANVAGYTALLPERFIVYLESYYYAGFDLAKGNLPPSRHAFTHGVGPDEQMLDPVFALRLFLTLDQVFFCLSRMKDPGAQAAESELKTGAESDK